MSLQRKRERRGQRLGGVPQEFSLGGKEAGCILPFLELAVAALGVPKGGRVGKSFQLRPGNPPTWRRRDDTPGGPSLVQRRMLAL